MTRPMILLGTIALLSLPASPAAAQHVINNPGWCAYPNANCQNGRPGNPYTSYGWRRAYHSYGYEGNRRHYGDPRSYRQPVGQANLSFSYW